MVNANNYANKLPGNTRTNIPWTEKFSENSPRIIGLCRGLSEWGIRYARSPSWRNSLSVASSLISAATICPSRGTSVCSIRTRSPSSIPFWFIESHWALKKKYFFEAEMSRVETGISVSIFSSANIGIPQAIVPIRGIKRTSTLSERNVGDIRIWSWLSR